jgi:tetratricopeptide (TPR) repeat protein
MDTLGWIYYKKGLYGSAIGELKESAEKLAENAVVHYHLGLAYFKNGNLKEAKESLEKSLSLDSKHEGAEEAKTVLGKL